MAGNGTSPVKREYTVYLRMDTQRQEFIIEFFNAAGKPCYRTAFSRQGKYEKREGLEGSMLNFFISYPERYNVKIKYAPYPPGLTEEIHRIFPYVPVFTDIPTFNDLYEKKNSSFPYRKYMEMESLWRQLHREAVGDGMWKSVSEKGMTALFCKWRGGDGRSHSVLMDDAVFFSDLSYYGLMSEEGRMTVSSQIKAAAFAEACPESRLDGYLENGGRRVFAYLTSAVQNPPMRFLGEAGFSKLADSVERAESIRRSGKNAEEVFGLDISVLRALNDGEGEMFYQKEDRALLARAFRESPAAFDEPMTGMATMWIRYYYTLYPMGVSRQGSLRSGDLGDTIHYLNRMAQKNKDEFMTFCLYQDYISRSQTRGSYPFGLYPDNLRRAVELMTEG